MSVRYARPVMTVALVALAAAPLAGQTTRRFLFEARGGVAVPSGGFADEEKTGFDLGAGLGYRLARHWWSHLDYDYTRNTGKFTTLIQDIAPNYRVHNVKGELGFGVPMPDSPIAVEFDAGGGVSHFQPYGRPNVASQTYFGVTGGARITVGVNSRLQVLMSPQVNVAFANQQKLGERRVVMWPFALGLQYRM